MNDESERSGVFLSYKREDEKFALQFHYDLKLRGVGSPWIDLEGIRLGESWKAEITEAISQRSHFVVFLTPEALKSEEVAYEWKLALDLRKKVIPVILRGLSTDDVPEPLREKQITVASEGDGYDEWIVQLAKALPRPHILPTMAHVPAGEFSMGPPNDEYVVYLDEFWIAKTSVTYAEFACFARAGGYTINEYWEDGLTADKRYGSARDQKWANFVEQYSLDSPAQPMRGVSFYEALAYCKWLFMISNHPFSLPNEAQWEKAARGTDKRPWATGVNPGTAVVDVKDGSRERENPRNCGITGSESPYGCMDMVGQVWNWTVSIDTMHRFEPSKQENILDDVFAPRMIRGGSWKAGPAKAYAYHRESQLPVPADYPEEIGFRLVTSKDPTGLDIP